MLVVLLEAAMRSLALAAAVGIGLTLFRVRNPHIALIAWKLVLAAAFLMPGLMMLSPLEVALPWGDQAQHWTGLDDILLLPPRVGEPLSGGLSSDIPRIPQTAHAVPAWRTYTEIAYLLIAGLLIARSILGVTAAWRLCRRAEAVTGAWTRGYDVRASTGITMPGTVGSTIIVPAHHEAWSKFFRDAVIAHESNHVRSRDFYWQLLAGFYRAVFWFSPLGWWLPRHIANLSELASDAAAIAAVRDRVAYAEVLVEVSRRTLATPSLAVAMASRHTLVGRIERLVGDAKLYGPIGFAGRAGITAVTLSLAAAVTVAVADVPATHPAAYQDAHPVAVIAPVIVRPAIVAMSVPIAIPESPAVRVAFAAPAVIAPPVIEADVSSPLVAESHPARVTQQPQLASAPAEKALECTGDIRTSDEAVIIDSTTLVVRMPGESSKRVTVVNDPLDTGTDLGLQKPNFLCVNDRLAPFGLERGVSLVVRIDALSLEEARTLLRADPRGVAKWPTVKGSRVELMYGGRIGALCNDPRLTILQIKQCTERMSVAETDEARAEIRDIVRATIKRRQTLANRQRGYADNFNLSPSMSAFTHNPGPPPQPPQR